MNLFPPSIRSAVSVRSHPSFLILLVATLLLVAGMPTRAQAADEEEKARVIAAKALATKIGVLRKAKDAAGAKSAMNEAVELHNQLETSGAKKGLQGAVGKVLKDKKMGGARIDAAEALGKMDDPKGAYKQLKKVLPDVKNEEPGPMDVAVLKVVGSLAPDSAIPALLELMQKAKNNAIAKAAVVALGNYGASKKRVMVLEEILSTMRIVKPGRSLTKRISTAARERWSALGRPMVTSMNQLTGQEIGDAEEWLETAKSYKKKLAKLFIE